VPGSAAPQPHVSQHGTSAWKVVVPLLVLGLCSYLSVDHAVSARLVEQGGLPGDLDKLLDAAEHYGTPFGQALILWLVFAVDRRRAWRIPRLAATAIMGGLAANLVKLSIARVRPKYFDFTGVADRFSGWFPLGDGGSRYQSFPSAHTASAVAFAVAICWAYPKGRTVFLTLAGLVALQRIEANAHFVSDTCVGAALGWMIGSWSVGNTRLSRWWEAREERWKQAKIIAPTIDVSVETLDVPLVILKADFTVADTRRAA
jgi:membrane-associated phospholipid phosphatase